MGSPRVVLCSALLQGTVLLGSVRPCQAQAGQAAVEALPPAGYGSLTQNDLSLRVRNSEIEVRFLPLDERVLRLLAGDSYESLRSLVHSRRPAIDSIANQAGVSRPGLALVTFFALQSNARYDPQTLTLVIRNRVFRPLGIVPFSPRFSAQQLDVRDQVSGICLFQEDIPVTDSFTLSYNGLVSDDWQTKQRLLDRERARVAARSRTARPDTTAAPGER
jgi:hypothetical protein